MVLALGALRHRPGALIGDEGTFVAMAASLARDGDLEFDAADEAWARARAERPAALILQRSARGVTYSKPILFPLVAAPLYAALGRAGVVTLNLLAVGAALSLVAAALARRAGGERAVETVLLFGFGSTVFPYLAWAMTEALQVALATAGLALTLAGELGARRGPAPGRWARLVDARGAPWAGAVLLGLLVALREPNALVAAVPAVAVAAAGRWRRALALAATSAGVYALVAALTWGLAGAPNPYKAERATFNAETGYPTPGSPALARFDRLENLATSSLGALPSVDAAGTAYATLYFVLGRHTGLLAYFPAALALLAAAAGGSDRTGRAALAGFGAASAFYLVYWPANYFGGETALGNRYLLAAYPCLLFAAARLPSRRAAAAAWAVAFLVGASALVSTVRTRAGEASSQSHAHAGLFRRLPYESTAPHIEGRRDRYWARDFVRFVDPYARVERWSFELRAGEPAAELEIATAWSGTPLRFLAVSTERESALVFSDWLGRRRFSLAAFEGGGAGGPIAWHPSPAWRFHPFWFRGPQSFRARMVRMRLEGPAGSTVRLRYLGRERIPAAGFAREVVRAELPAHAVAGAPAAIAIEAVNRGGWSWSSERTLPVRLAVSLAALDGSESREWRWSLAREVAPGERLRQELDLVWPQRAGDYRVRVDLLVEDVAWFAEKLGTPIAEGVVRVLPGGAAAAAAPPVPSHP